VIKTFYMTYEYFCRSQALKYSTAWMLVLLA